MGVANVPAAAGGGIKTVQRGSAGASGNVTITAVDIAKSFVTVFGSASSGVVSSSFGLSVAAGTVAITGVGKDQSNINSLRRPPSSTATGTAGSGTPADENNAGWSQSVASNIGAVTVNAGSNNLVSAVVTGFLASSTILTVSGACRFEVVEFA